MSVLYNIQSCLCILNDKIYSQQVVISIPELWRGDGNTQKLEIIIKPPAMGDSFYHILPSPAHFSFTLADYKAGHFVNKLHVHIIDVSLLIITSLLLF
jgi:hypothetical protein